MKTDELLPERFKKIILFQWFKILIRKSKFSIFLSVVFVFLNGFLLVQQSWILARILDASIISHIPRNQLLLPILCFSGLLSLRIFLIYVSEVIGVNISENIKCLIRKSLMNQLSMKNPQWVRKQSSGALASGIIEQVEAMDSFFSRYLSASVNAIVIPLSFSILIFPIDWFISLLLIVTLPLIPIFMFLVGKGSELASRRKLRVLARLSGLFADRLRGLDTLKLYGQAEYEVKSISDAGQQLRRTTMSVLRIAFLSSAILELFSALSIAGIAVYISLNYLGFLNNLNSSFGLHSGLFCLFIAPEIYFPLRKFANHYHDRASAKAAAKQLEILFSGLPDLEIKENLAKPEIEFKHNSKAKFISIEIKATDLNIQSDNRKKPIIDHANFRIFSGQHIALMGESGSGKTSLLESIARLRNFTGKITLNGVSLSDWDENHLRESMYFVMQRPYLFSGSISENILLGTKNVSKRSFEDASRMACVNNFTGFFLNGFNTILGQGGFGISMGQAQRIAIARLFLRDPRIILMDEPTAHLDPKTQDQLLTEILDFSKARTLLLVTHSDSVAKRFPTVWNISQRRISIAS